jgi:serine/threonine protein kinase
MNGRGSQRSTEANSRALADRALALEAATVAPSDRSVGVCREPYWPATLPQVLGDYVLLEEIARGGMGVVYKARQVSLDRVVAVKMVLAGELATAEDLRRFCAEAQAAASLDHPGIVPIFEVGAVEDRHFYSMAYVPGTSLAEQIAAGPLPPRRAAELLADAADAVHYAHVRGVIHRDLKPANILLDTAGRPRITDFGIAKRIRDDTDTTARGEVVGTPNYMPPEQAAGETTRIGPWSDVYALGAVLYALLTGRPPFQAASQLDTLLQVVAREPVPARHLNSQVPRDLNTIVMKCLAKLPPRRYGSAQVLAEDLRRYLAGEPIRARPPSPWTLAGRWCRQHLLVAGVSGSAAILLMAAASVAVVAYHHESAQRHELEARYDEAMESLIDTTRRLEAEQRLRRMIESRAAPHRAGHAGLDEEHQPAGISPP